ncbi:MAG: hypothetical protein CSA66_05450 [Proteobacteria bacterium]|nr:MAG: hypothetical protein CSA66_05450 [Pseudomonadota bacterium]
MGKKRWGLWGAGIGGLLVAVSVLLVWVGAANVESVRLPDGSERDYLLITPDDEETPRPLVVLLHEELGSPQTALAVSGLDRLAEARGFYLAAPVGSPPLAQGRAPFGVGVWNVGFCCGLAAEARADDVGFVRAVIAQITATHAVDTDRVYLAGYRTGGALAERAACALAEVDGVAIVSGDNAGPSCDPGRPLPLVSIHGLADPCAPIGGGASCGGCAERFGQLLMGIDNGAYIPSWPCEPVVDHLRPWREAAGCEEARRVVHEEPGVRCHVYEGCAPGAAFTACEVERHGHLWPGAQLCGGSHSPLCHLMRKVFGPVEADFDAAAYLWRALSAARP